MMTHNKAKPLKKNTRSLIKISLPVGGEMKGRQLGLIMMGKVNNRKERLKMKPL